MEKVNNLANGSLASMAIASMAGGYNANVANKATKGSGFQNFLNNAGNSDNVKKNTTELNRKKSDIYSKADKSKDVNKDVSKDVDKNEELEDNKKNLFVNNTSENTYNQADEVAPKEEIESDEKPVLEDLSEDTDNNEVELNAQVVSIDPQVTEKIDTKEKEVIKETAEITGLSEEQVEAVLSEMGISALQLSDKDTLNEFMQKAFDVESPIELLNVDGAKEMMAEIMETAETAVEELSEEEPNMIEQLFQTSIEKKADVKADERFEKLIENDTQVSKEIAANNDLTQFTAINESQMQQGMTFNMSQNGSGFDANQYFAEGSSELQNFAVNGTVMENINNALNNVIAKEQDMSGHVNSSEIIRQIIERIEIQGNEQQVNELKITLKPEYLGEVSLKIASQNGIITAQFTAESQRVKEIIESNFDALKDSLLQQGIEIGGLEVNVGNSDSNPSFFGGAGYDGTNRDIMMAEAEEVMEENSGYIDENEVVEASVSYQA